MTVVITKPQAGAELKGTVTVEATYSGQRFEIATCTFDGQQVASDAAQPISFQADTTKVPNGSHQLIVAVRYRTAGGKVRWQKASIPVSVANVPAPPPPPPPTTYPATFYNGPGQGKLLPAKGTAYLGTAQADGAGEPPVATQLAALESYIGRKVRIEHRFMQTTNTLDLGTINAIVARQHIPMISWMPNPSNGGRILAGEADAGIRSVGQQIASQPHTIFLRPYWEHNGFWYNHSKRADGSRLDPAEHKAMWRRTVDKLREGGAFPKAQLVWCPHEGHWSGSDSHGNFGDAWDDRASYPGDDYVDWVGADEYNGGNYCGFHDGWCEFGESFTHGRMAPQYQPVGIEVEYRGRKPFMVGEVGCYEDGSHSKGDWFRKTRDYIKAYMPNCLAFVYFDIDTRLYGESKNWRINTSEASKQGFRDLANDAYFKG